MILNIAIEFNEVVSQLRIEFYTLCATIINPEFSVERKEIEQDVGDKLAGIWSIA